MVNVNIRKFRKQDLADVRIIMERSVSSYYLVDLHRYFYGKIPIRIKWFLIEHSLDSIFTNRYDMQVFVAEASEKVVGAAIIRYAGQNVWEICRLAVHPNRQGKGIGFKLISKIMSYVKQRKGKVITLSTNINNKKAIKLYRRFGFTETYTVQHVFAIITYERANTRSNFFLRLSDRISEFLQEKDLFRAISLICPNK